LERAIVIASAAEVGPWEPWRYPLVYVSHRRPHSKAVVVGARALEVALLLPGAGRDCIGLRQFRIELQGAVVIGERTRRRPSPPSRRPDCFSLGVVRIELQRMLIVGIRAIHVAQVLFTVPAVGVDRGRFGGIRIEFSGPVEISDRGRRDPPVVLRQARLL